MKKSFAVAIALPGKHLLTFEARQIMLPSKKGYIGFMAGRQPMLATMEPGLISIIDIEDHHLIFGTTGGFAEMLDNQASLLCDSLIDVKELDLNDTVVPAGVIYNRDTSQMTEKQKRDYVKLLMINRLRKKSATAGASTRTITE
jgi:F0F1-type ATP synthase epsilon subunit